MPMTVLKLTIVTYYLSEPGIGKSQGREMRRPETKQQSRKSSIADVPV